MSVGRPKAAENTELVRLTEEYYISECHGDTDALKYQLIANYAQKHGYQYAEHLFRRNDFVRQRIEDIKHGFIPEPSKAVVSLNQEVFVQLNVPEFLARNRRPEDLALSLEQRDDYYHSIYDRAMTAVSAMNELHAQTISLNAELHKVKEEYAGQIQELKKKIAEDEKQNKQLIASSKSPELLKEVHFLKKFIRTYVNPEMANLILGEKGMRNNILIDMNDEQLKNIVSTFGNLTPENAKPEPSQPLTATVSPKADTSPSVNTESIDSNASTAAGMDVSPDISQDILQDNTDFKSCLDNSLSPDDDMIVVEKHSRILSPEVIVCAGAEMTKTENDLSSGLTREELDQILTSIDENDIDTAMLSDDSAEPSPAKKSKKQDPSPQRHNEVQIRWEHMLRAYENKITKAVEEKKQ